MLILPKRLTATDLEAIQEHEGFTIVQGSFSERPGPQDRWRARIADADLYLEYIIAELGPEGTYHIYLNAGLGDEREYYWFGASIENTIYGPLAHVLYAIQPSVMKRSFKIWGIQLYLGDLKHVAQTIWGESLRDPAY